MQKTRKILRIFTSVLAAATVFCSSALALESVEATPVAQVPVQTEAAELAAAVGSSSAIAFDGTFETTTTEDITALIESGKIALNGSAYSVEADPNDPTNKALKLTGTGWNTFNFYFDLPANVASVTLRYDIWADPNSTNNGEGGVGLTTSVRYGSDSRIDNTFITNTTYTTTATPHTKNYSGAKVGDLSDTRFCIQTNNLNYTGVFWVDNLSITYTTMNGMMFEDFEDIPVGTYQNQGTTLPSELVTLAPLGTATTVEVMQDTVTGNKFLKVSGQYASLGYSPRVYDGTRTGNEFAKFDYKVVSGDGFQAYYGSKWGSHSSTALKSGTWTEKLMTVSVSDNVHGLVLLKTNDVIYIDNVYFWSHPSDAANTPTVTTTFVNSTDAPSDVAIPAAVTNPLWNTDGATIDLSAAPYVLTTADENYKFRGWSTKDGGEPLLSTTYYPALDQTLYAVWTKLDPTVKPIYAIETFEDYEVGYEFPTTDGYVNVDTFINDFLVLQPTGAEKVITSAKIVYDETKGSNVLEVVSDNKFFTLSVEGHVRDTSVAGNEGWWFEGITTEANSTGIPNYGRILQFCSSNTINSNAYTPQSASNLKWALFQYWKSFHITEAPADSYKNKYFSFFAVPSTGLTVRFDNIVYWKYPDTMMESSKTMTLTFDAGEATGAAMPAAVTAEFLSYYDLDTVAIPAPTETKRFVGWSETPDGDVIDESVFVLADKTYYAIWEDRVEVTAPTYKVIDFEDYDVGEINYKSQIDFMYTGTEIAGGAKQSTSATIKEEANGNQYLEMVVPQYGGITFNKRDDASKVAYVAFDLEVDGTVGAQFFGGTGSNIVHQRMVASNFASGVSLPTSWKTITINGTGLTDVLGFYVQPSAGATFRVDNLYYYELPVGVPAEDVKVTYTFADNAHEAVKATFMTKYTLPTLADTITHHFVGWSETADGPALVDSTILALENKTFYPVWAENFTSANLHQIRETAPLGLRFAFLIECNTAANSDRYGFIVARKQHLDDAGVTLENFTHGSVSNMLEGLAKQTKDGAEIVYDEDGTKISGVVKDKNKAITAVITNIPTGKESENFVVRPFFTIGGTTYYGTADVQNYDAVANK